MTTDRTPQSDQLNQNAVCIEPWSEGDLLLLTKLLGDPAMMVYLGGPETDEQLVKRQIRYERLTEEGKGRMFKIIDAATGEAIGSVGYWESQHQGALIYEIGWSVLPTFQGRGIAGAAVAHAIVIAQADGKHQFLHAFPSVDNLASNALCQKSGFTLIETCAFEYPKGHVMQCNDWRLDLFVKRES